MSKILTAYFSASGTTAKTAKLVAEASGSDIFEIKPQQPYSPSDIKWTNPLARCNKEKIAHKDVPIEGTVSGFSEYDLIIIGFPIWYYGAPNIINTFVKQYDFTGKKIAVFATSGGSGIGKTADKLKKLMGGNVTVAGSVLFKADDTADTVRKWVESLR